MADDLSEQYAKLLLDDDEGDDVVDLGGIITEEAEDKTALMLVGRLLTDRPFNVDAFKRTMIQAWAMTGRVVVRNIGPKLFAFQFFHWRDKEKVLQGCPWCFDQQLLILTEITGDEQPTEVALNHSPFWVRIRNLPFNCRSKEAVRAVANCLGEIVEVEEDEFGIDKDRRVRVIMDVRKPLRRKRSIKNRRGDEVEVEFRYERLPFFCFLCGMLGHSERDCSSVPDEERTKGFKWGLNLRASPRKGRSQQLEEVEALKAVKKVLFVPKRTNLTESSRSEVRLELGAVGERNGNIVQGGKEDKEKEVHGSPNKGVQTPTKETSALVAIEGEKEREVQTAGVRNTSEEDPFDQLAFKAGCGGGRAKVRKFRKITQKRGAMGVLVEGEGSQGLKVVRQLGEGVGKSDVGMVGEKRKVGMDGDDVVMDDPTEAGRCIRQVFGGSEFQVTNQVAEIGFHQSREEQ